MKLQPMTFEAVKVSMSQTKDGVRVVMVLHPNEGDTSELFTHPVGSRYQMVLVRVGDDEKPIPRPKGGSGEEAVRAAGMLCRHPDFQLWLVDQGYTLNATEAEAAIALHKLCGINSRADLATNEEARMTFNQIRLRFSAGQE